MRLMETGDLDRAVAAFSEAIELWPNFRGAYVHRRTAYGRLGRNFDTDADSAKVGALIGETPPVRPQQQEAVGATGKPGILYELLRAIVDYFISPRVGTLAPPKATSG